MAVPHTIRREIAERREFRVCCLKEGGHPRPSASNVRGHVARRVKAAVVFDLRPGVLENCPDLDLKPPAGERRPF